MKKSFFLNSSGVTMVELLLVISVIAILSSATIVIFPFVFSEKKDSEIKDDVARIQSELERYYNKNSKYPEPYNNNDIPSSFNPKYTYCYATSSAGYDLYAQLQSTPSGAPSYSCPPGPGGSNYNYKVTNP
ncbi:MAG: type II secretion system GspH family protein [Patescibacteria group bacterium]|nr:type II secretion system GspH family protein [Patescibacteria group bacterium]